MVVDTSASLIVTEHSLSAFIACPERAAAMKIRATNREAHMTKRYAFVILRQPAQLQQKEVSRDREPFRTIHRSQR